MPFKVPSPNELPQTARNAIQALKDYVDGLGRPTDWTAPSLEGTWVNFDATNWQPAQYRKVGEVVMIRGLVKNGTANTTIFTLPVGFRPPLRLIFPTDTSTGYGRFDVRSDGGVLQQAGGTGWISLNCQFSIS